MSKGFQKGNKIMLGRKLPLAWRLNIGKASRGRKVSKETRKKLSVINTGKKHSEETKKKISVSKKGKPMSKKNKIGISKALKGKPKTKEHVEKVRQSLIRYYKDHPNLLRGKNSPTWQGGITPVNAKIRNSIEYKGWREKVFKRDNWTCVWCESRSAKGKKVVLNADHIQSFAKYPKLRLVVSNGRTLCLNCHKLTDNYLNRWR